MAKTSGKKVGVLHVRLKRMTSRHYCATIDVELRLNVGSGTFYATYEGQQYDALTKDALVDKIREAADKTIDVEWTRYLVVRYSAKAWPLDGDSGRPKDSGSYSDLGLDDDRALLVRDPKSERWHGRNETRVITGIDLHWEVCEISTPYTLPENRDKTVRMHREVHCQRIDRTDETDETEGYREIIGSPVEQADDSLPVGAVAWTVEREALLREILAALGKLDARMLALFSGGPDKLARQLDTAAQFDPGRLLAAAAPSRKQR